MRGQLQYQPKNMTNKLDTSPNQADASADMQRRRLRSKVSHAVEILHEQGPIGTFIHSDEAPETFVVGDDRTIDSYDVPRFHLLHGIDPLDPVHLSWQIHREQAAKRFREDLPDATRTILLEKAGTDLHLSLDHIGREWMFCDSVQSRLSLNLPDHVRERLCYQLREVPVALAEVMPDYQLTGYI